MPGYVIRTILAALLVLFYTHAYAANDTADCDIQKGPCIKVIDNKEVVFDINPKPVKVMKELSFTVDLKGGGDPEELIIALDMVGMYMGENRFFLESHDNGKFTGKRVLPRCPSGKKLWRATIEIPNTGKVDFLFNVEK